MTYLDNAADPPPAVRGLRRARHRGRARQPPAAHAHPGTAPGEGAAAGLRQLRRPGAGRPHGAHRRPRAGVPGRSEGQDRAPLPARRIASCWNSAAPSKARTRRSSTPWDVAYYAEKQRAALYDFDEEALRPYFPLERVVAGLFDLVNRLYGIRVTEEPGVPVWDPQVRYYNMRDENGVFLGGFYADWYPRENKRGGAWMDALITGGPAPDGFRPHLGLICGNLTPPVGGKPGAADAPRSGDDLPRVRPPAASPAEPRRDPVAGGHQRGVGLRRAALADHGELVLGARRRWTCSRATGETGEPIPDDLFQKMKRARTFRAANAQMRQLGFGFIDLLLHVRYSPERDGDPVGLHAPAAAGVQPRAAAAGARHDRGLHAPVRQPGGLRRRLLLVQVGRGAGRRRVHALPRRRHLQPRDRDRSSARTSCRRATARIPAELYRRFMGREPDPQALLVRSGLA